MRFVKIIFKIFLTGKYWRSSQNALLFPSPRLGLFVTQIFGEAFIAVSLPPPRPLTPEAGEPLRAITIHYWNDDMEVLGISTLRFTNADVLNNIENMIVELKNNIDKLLLKSGERFSREVYPALRGRS